MYDTATRGKITCFPCVIPGFHNRQKDAFSTLLKWTHTHTQTSVGKTSGKLSRPVIKIKPVPKQSKGSYVGISRPAVRVELAQFAPLPVFDSSKILASNISRDCRLLFHGFNRVEPHKRRCKGEEPRMHVGGRKAASLKSKPRSQFRTQRGRNSTYARSHAALALCFPCPTFFFLRR